MSLVDQGRGFPPASTAICGPSKDVRRRMIEMELSMTNEERRWGEEREVERIEGLKELRVTEERERETERV